MATDAAQEATDPVCGMTVTVEHASQAGLTTEHNSTPYYFCGKGCLLEFRDNPDRYLAAGYEPRM